jgi:RNA polymerase sigma factor (sigma-70 family)
MAPRPNPDELQRRRAQILDEVMRSKKGRLWAQARRFTASDQDADDALEDACIAFLRYFRPEPGSNPAGWMMTTVKHAALKVTRHGNLRRQRSALPEDPGQHDAWWESSLPDLGPSPQERVEAREWVTRRADLFAQLKPDQRTALWLLAFGFSYLEIGERQGWTQTKVNRCVAEGRGRLRELLAKGGKDRERQTF